MGVSLSPAGAKFSELTKRQRYELLRRQLESERASFISHWRDLNDYILPRRGRFTVTDANKGDRRSKNIIDSTATFSARTLSSGMMSGVTSPARPWFRLSTPDPDLAEFDAVKEWLHTVTQRMQTVFIRSNLYNALPTLYLDMGVFATAAMALLEDDEDVIRCYPFPIGSYTLANDERLRVRVLMREFRMTVRQLVSQFTLKKVSSRVQTLWERGNYEEWIDVVHAVMPNQDYDGDKLESKFKRFAACYYEKASPITEDDMLEESGFDEFPVLAPRWETVGEDVYGTNCPGMTALGDIKQLQTGEKRSLQAVEKQINPPMTGPGSLRGQRVSILPGDITYVDDAQQGKNSFRAAHEVRLSIAELEAKQGQCRERIKRAFYEDLFLMLAYGDDSRGAQPVTAREIEERHEEKLLVLGPVLEQLNQDLLDPLIDRTFTIMARRRLIPDAPQELQGVALKVEYVSIMHQAQKMAALSGIDRFTGYVTQLATLDPSVLDKVNRDELVDEVADITGIAPRIIVPDEQVAAVRQARARAARLKEAASIAKDTATAAHKTSQASAEQTQRTLSDVLTGGGAPDGAGSAV